VITVETQCIASRPRQGEAVKVANLKKVGNLGRKKISVCGDTDRGMEIRKWKIEIA
jgi:hypothetical protein